MKTIKEFVEEINEPSRAEQETTIAKLKNEVLELCDLADTLEYNLKMVRQALSNNYNEYFALTGKYLKYRLAEGTRRNRIANDYIFQSINEIREIQNKLSKKEGEA